MLKVPKLRFGEFEGEWVEETLLNLSSEKFSNGTFNDPKKVGKGYRLINVKDMYIGNLIDTNNLTLLDIEKKEFEKNKAEYGDIFFTRSSLVKEGIAYSNVYLSKSDDITYDGHLIRMRPDNKQINSIFLSYLLKTSSARKQLIVRGKTATMTTIGQEDVSSSKVFFPKKIEQQKIANFLTSIDKKIEQLTQKKTLLENYKKGVMQKVFSQELRFKHDDGGTFEDWEEKRLGDSIYNIGGTALEKFVDKNSSYKFISIGNYSKDGKYIDNGQRIILNDKTSTKLLNKNDLVMVLNDKTLTGDIIGSTILIKKNDSFIYNQRSERLICKKELSPLYIWHYFNSVFFRKKIFSISQGGTQIYVNFSSVKNIILDIPFMEEQEKIANYLTTLDQKITQTTQQIEAMQSFKKGLLQQMFV